MLLTPMPVDLHDQTSYVAPHFNCLDLWNTVVSLTMPLACDAKGSGVTQ